jgi:hypothetical protein
MLAAMPEKSPSREQIFRAIKSVFAATLSGRLDYVEFPERHCKSMCERVASLLLVIVADRGRRSEGTGYTKVRSSAEFDVRRTCHPVAP